MRLPPWKVLRAADPDVQTILDGLLECTDTAAPLQDEVEPAQQRAPPCDAAEIASDHDVALAELDRELVLQTVAKEGSALASMPASMRTDREVVLKAVSDDGSSLAFASKDLQADLEVVLRAVLQDAAALQHASLELRADRTVILQAIQQDADVALLYASEDVRGDSEIVLQAIERDHRALKHANRELQSDRAFALKAAARNGMCLSHLQREFRYDHEVVLEAVSCCGQALEFAAPALRANPEIALRAVVKDFLAMEYVPEELLHDGAFVIQIWKAAFGPPRSWDKVTKMEDALQHCPMEVLQVLADSTDRFLIVRVSMLSGRACVLLCQAHETAWTIATRSSNRKRLCIGTGLAAEPILVINGQELSETLTVERWPGIELGKVNQVDVVVKPIDPPPAGQQGGIYIRQIPLG
mmetsp:Transcript_22769/g.53121  ORF Transcript_22769/g.53121 Transcript_22769/m.53121 type:complete len:413 (+) Transcript_22769:101-1339(+)